MSPRPAPSTAAARSLAEQTEAELGGPVSVLVRQQRDHVRLGEV